MNKNLEENNADTTLIYITASNEQEALSIGKQLMIRKLAACINVLPGMQSMYWWEGKLETSQEAVLLVKTTQSAWKQVEACVQEFHSYKCPCLISIRPDQVHTEYLKWWKKQMIL